jgi:hypothetical protein
MIRVIAHWVVAEAILVKIGLLGRHIGDLIGSVQPSPVLIRVGTTIPIGIEAAKPVSGRGPDIVWAAIGRIP